MTIDTYKLPKVQVRATWGSAWPWTDVPFLDPDDADCTLAPTIPTARLRWEYGRIDPRDGSGFAKVARQSGALINQFCRILSPHIVDGVPDGTFDARWWGVITSTADQVQSTQASPPAPAGGNVAAGTEHFTARGLEYLLESVVIEQSITTEDGTTASAIDTLLPFNFYEQRNDRLLGNRSTSKIDVGGGLTCYVFSATDGALWTAADVVEYLVACWAPLDMDLTGATGLANLALQTESWPQRPGGNLYQALSEVAKRQRGHTFRVLAVKNGDGESETAPSLSVDIVTIFPDSVTWGSTTITGASSTVSIDGDDGRIEDLSILHSSEHQYDRIVVRGGPIILMGTFVFGTPAAGQGTLIEAWDTTTLQAAFLAATDQDRAAMKYEQVFTSYRVSPGTLPGGVTCSDAGALTWNPTAQPPTFELGKRFARELPVLKDSVDVLHLKEFVPAWAGLAYYQTGTGNAYMECQRMKEVFPGAPAWAMRVLHGELGFAIEARPNQLLALNHWSGTPAPADTAAPPVIDYATAFGTMAWASDEYLRVEKTLDAPVFADLARTLTIELPHLQAWYRLPHCVTDCVAGAQVVETSGAELRNDYAMLNAVAALAQAWYGRQRAAVRIAWEDAVYDYSPGQKVTTITQAVGDITVNSIISRIHWDFTTGKTQLDTDFGELDAAAVAGVWHRGGGFMAPPPMAAPAADAHLPARPVCPATAAGVPLGTPTGAYTSGSTITLQPCDSNGVSTGGATVTVQAGWTLPGDATIPTSAIIPYQPAAPVGSASPLLYALGQPKLIVTDSQITFDGTTLKGQKKRRLDFGWFCSTEESAWVDSSGGTTLTFGPFVCP